MTDSIAHELLIGHGLASVEPSESPCTAICEPYGMYHVELRQFPHNFCRFNLTEGDLRESILEAWARGEWIEMGERKWNPHQAKLTVLEGPQLPVGELSMGRGWRNAERRSHDVTERLLAAAPVTDVALGGAGPGPGASVSAGDMGIEGARSPSEPGAQGPILSAVSSSDTRLAADSLGLEALSKLGEKPAPIVVMWHLARERYPEQSASDCLRLAEQAVRSLVESGLAVVLTVSEGGEGEPEPCAPGEQLERALGAVDNWTSTADTPAVLLRRK